MTIFISDTLSNLLNTTGSVVLRQQLHSLTAWKPSARRKHDWETTKNYLFISHNKLLLVKNNLLLFWFWLFDITGGCFNSWDMTKTHRKRKSTTSGWLSQQVMVLLTLLKTSMLIVVCPGLWQIMGHGWTTETSGMGHGWTTETSGHWCFEVRLVSGY